MCTFFPGGPLLPGIPGSPDSPGVPGRPCSSGSVNGEINLKGKAVPFFQVDLVPLVFHRYQVDLVHHLNPMHGIQHNMKMYTHNHRKGSCNNVVA